MEAGSPLMRADGLPAPHSYLEPLDLARGQLQRRHRSFLNYVYVSEAESNHCLLFSAQKYLADGGLRFSGFGISF